VTPQATTGQVDNDIGETIAESDNKDEIDAKTAIFVCEREKTGDCDQG
jgi:hypothetical protein